MQSDLISRSAVLDILYERFYDTEYPSEHEALEQKINNIPAIDAVPVVHAHWIKTFNRDGFVSTLRCSECGNSENSTYIPGNFCWFCGAKMDGGEDDENA